MGVRGLQERHGSYYARLTIPAELRPAFDGKREFRERLGTDRKKAERDVHATMAKFHAKIEQARRSLTPTTPARSLSVKEVARAHYADELKRDDAERFAVAKGYGVDFLPGWFAPYETLLRKVASRRASDEEAAAAIQWAIPSEQAKPGTDAWRELAYVLAAVQLDTIERKVERDRGDFDGGPKLAILDPRRDAPSTPSAAASDAIVLCDESLLPLVAVLDLMHREKQIREATKQEQRVAVRYFDEFAGSALPINAINRRHLTRFKDELRKTPLKYATRFPGKTLPEAVEANARLQERGKGHPTLSPVTINNKVLAHLKSLFSWALKQDFIASDPARGVRVDSGKSDSEPSRLPFSVADLQAIFADRDFCAPLSERAWAVLIAAYTGMRAGEVVQLRLDGIKHERGVLAFTVSGEVKNAGSRRIVPVHSVLLRHGLAERVAALQAAGETYLLPETMRRAMGRLEAAKAAGKIIAQPYSDIHDFWFQKSLLKRAGIVDVRKTFHSLRHTFKTELAKAGVPREISDMITGHTDSSAGARYIHAAPILAMADAIEMLRFT